MQNELGNRLIIELVGPAGAGKTTLSHSLSNRSDKIKIGPEIELRKLKYGLVFIGKVPVLLPAILQKRRSDRWFTWDEIKYLVYLEGWPSVLKKRLNHDEAVLLLDHGPVYKLATLNAFGPEGFRGLDFERWWNNMFKQWASILDIVIWLDAPDPVLERRINSRGQRHAVKGKTNAEVSRFLALYRDSYQQILAHLAVDTGPALVRFDTSQTTLEQITDVIIGLCNTRTNRN